MQHRSGRVLGIAILLQAATSLAGGIVLDFFLVVPDSIPKTMVKVAQHPDWMRVDILLEMMTAGGVIWLGALLLSTLRGYGKTAAQVAFALYCLEGAILAASRMGAFMFLSASQQYEAGGRPASIEVLGRVTYAAMDNGALLMMVAFCAGGFLFYGLLYRSRAVPRWLALWGLLSLIPVSAGTLGTILGLPVSFLLFVPYIPFEFILGGWILLAGLRVKPDSTSNSASPNP